MTQISNLAPTDDDRVTTDADRAIERELDALLAQPGLRRSPQMSAFLRYVVTRTLAGESTRIKAYTIGVDALGKPPEFDPQNDPSVRVLAKRLRDRLAEHYRQRPETRPRIEFRPGSYVPRFVGLETAETRGGFDALPERTIGLRAPPLRMTVPLASSGASEHRSGDTFFAMADGRRAYDRSRTSRSLPDIGNRARGTDTTCATAANATVIHVLTGVDDEAALRRLAFVVSGMLARLAGTDVRRVDRAQPSPAPGDLVVSMDALSLDAGLRIDLQLVRGDDGRILDAEALTLPPGSNGVLRATDLDTLQGWVSRLPLRPTASATAMPMRTVDDASRPDGPAHAATSRDERSRAAVSPFGSHRPASRTSTAPPSSSVWLASAPRAAD